MLARLLAWKVDRMIRGLRFPDQAPTGAALSHKVIDTFRSGCLAGLLGKPWGAVEESANALPWNMRAFFYEGHAMGRAGRCTLAFRVENPESAHPLGQKYRIMRFVGYGFWNGVIPGTPLRHLPETDRFWEGVPPFKKYRFLMANGYGFARTLLAGVLGASVCRDIARLPAGAGREAAWHGVGRALWFLYLGNFEKLGSLLRHPPKEVPGAFPDIVEPLAIGLGLAIAFTQVERPMQIVEAIHALPTLHRNPLLRGVGMAMQVHAENDPACRSRVEALLCEEFEPCYQAAWRAAEAAGDGPDWYTSYHAGIKKFALPAVSIYSAMQDEMGLGCDVSSSIR